MSRREHNSSFAIAECRLEIEHRKSTFEWQSEIVHKMLGSTFGYDAQPGTIRGDFGCSQRYNLIHGSDCPTSAQTEINLFFTPSEIIDYQFSDARWLYSERISPNK